MTHVDYPICVRLAGRRVLVVGGGVVAGRRARALIDAGAEVTVIAPVITERIAAVAYVPREFTDGDVVLGGYELVFVATDRADVTTRVVAEARAARIWVNAADVPALCDFTLPSVGRRGPITIAISTAGHAPALARRIRIAATDAIGRGHLELARVITFLRGRIVPGAARMQLLTNVVEGRVGDALLAGDRRAAFAQLRALVGGAS